MASQREMLNGPSIQGQHCPSWQVLDGLGAGCLQRNRRYLGGHIWVELDRDGGAAFFSFSLDTSRARKEFGQG